MRIEIINTGSELMLGFVLNTHQQWLCRQFADLGYVVDRQVAVADSGPAIQQAVRDALARADVILTTGGLGPTSDDITRDLVAELIGASLVMDAGTLQHIESFFSARARPMPPSTKVQALIPEGARILPNAHGTAPGLVIDLGRSQFRPTNTPGLLVMLPGPPRELRPMFTTQVAPLLLKQFPPGIVVCRTLKTTGLGESIIEEKIAGPLQPLAERGLEIGYCAKVGEVQIRLLARGDQSIDLVNEAGEIVRRLIGKYIFGIDDDSLETVVIRLLTERQQTLALAESCTGGFIAHRLTNVPGASAVLWGGMVTYSNEAKQTLLGVRAETLAQHGAVSEATAREMAEGLRERYGTRNALAVTGIAGPAGGSESKPVGTVYIALATADQTIVRQQLNPYDRETFKFVTSQQALELLRRRLVHPQSC